MIQGTTLDATFVDAQEAGTQVSLVLQIAAYVCMSRVKELLKLSVLQPFSTYLFSQGPPPGPETMIWKLEKAITAEETLEERALTGDEEALEAEKEKKNPMSAEHLCASCYLRGHSDYRKPAKAFGIEKPSDFFPKYLAQVCWTRCLQCQKDVGGVSRLEVLSLLSLRSWLVLPRSPCFATVAVERSWLRAFSL